MEVYCCSKRRLHWISVAGCRSEFRTANCINGSSIEFFIVGLEDFEIARRTVCSYGCKYRDRLTASFQSNRIDLPSQTVPYDVLACFSGL